MSRRYCHSPQELWRNSNRPPALSASHSVRETSRFCPIGHPTDRASLHESDADRGGTNPRRRIAVACSRCRKRKIKCSGDPGTGQGCLNCKNAGTGPEQCQFVRVGSITALCATPTTCDYPYDLEAVSSIPSGMNSIASSLGQVTANSFNLTTSIAPAVYSSNIHYPRVHPTHTYPSVYPGTTARHQYFPGYHSGLADASFDPYNIQPSQYISPAQDSPSSTATYGAAEPVRHLLPAAGFHRPSHGIALEQDGRSKYGMSSIPYMNSSGSTTSGASDGSSIFPTMEALASSLPAPIVNSDRILPNPASSTMLNASGSTLGSALGSLGDAIPFLSSQPTSARSAMPWSPERITTGGSQHSTSSTSLSTIGLIGTTSSKSSSSPTECQSTSTFGYIPIAQSSSSNGTGPTVSTSTASFDDQVSSSYVSYSSTSSNDHLLRSHDSSSNLYTYGIGGDSGKRGSIAESTTSDGTLLSGQPYTRLRPTQPLSAPSYDDLRQESSEPTSRSTQRTPVSNVANSRR